MMTQEEKDDIRNGRYGVFLCELNKLVAEGRLVVGDPVSFVTGASSVFMGTGEPISKSGQTALRDGTIPLTRQPDGSFSVPKRLKP